MAETYNLKPHKGPKRPLEVVKVMPARNGSVRFCLNSGSHVTALATGEYACLARKCIDANRATRCEHVEFVKDYDATHGEEIVRPMDLARQPSPDDQTDPYLVPFSAGPTGGIHNSVSAAYAPRHPKDAA